MNTYELTFNLKVDLKIFLHLVSLHTLKEEQAHPNEVNFFCPINFFLHPF